MRLFESHSTEARLRAAAEFVRGFPPATNLILVGPSRDAIDDFARANTPGAAFGWHRFTLPQLAKRLAAADLASHGQARATALGVEAVAARAAFLLQREGRLPYFAPVAKFPGFARALASTLLELRMARLTPASLVTDIFKLRDAPALQDLSWLLERFEEQCGASGLADWAAVLATAEEAAKQTPSRDPVLLLDLPIHTPAERAFLRAYLQGAPDVLVTLPAGDLLSMEAVNSWGKVARIADAASSSSSLDRLRRHLFSEDTLEPGDADDAVTFFSAPGEGRECVEIARRILAEAREGVPFDRMAVFTRSPESYAAVLETALGRAGIPAYFVRGARRPDPTGRAFLALLGCAVEQLSARAFAEYLSLGQVPMPDAEGAPPAIARPWVAPEDEAVPEMAPAPVADTEALPEDTDDSPYLDGSLRAPWNWEKLLVEASVIGGLDRWKRRLVGLEFERRLQLRETDDVHRAARERELRNLRHLRAFALPIIEKLANLPTDAVWGLWLDALGALAPMALRAPDRVLALLAEMRPMSEMGPVNLVEVREVLSARLATLPQEPPGNRYGRVMVAPIEQARGRSFDVVFVPGLAERMFPRKPREDPLLLDDPRIGLGPAAALASQDQRAARERLLLHLAAGAARRKLYLSYPRMELASSRSRVPSFYGLDVVRAVTGAVPDYKNLERDATAAAQARLAWPAPPTTASAIDEMEYDLAALGPSLRLPRFLLELNPALRRSLRTRYARWDIKAWSGHDGLVLGRDSSDAVRAVLEKRSLRQRAYSASNLQRFAACPYQLYLSAILHLRPRPEPVAVEEMDALTRGSLFHRVQARLLRQLLDEKRLPVSAGNLTSAQRTMDEALNRTAAEYEEDLAPAIPGVWAAGVEAIRADLRGWLLQLSANPGQWLPAYFEFGFGLRQSDNAPESVEEPVRVPGDYLLRGAVDLIEGSIDPATETATALRIIDHKTGANRTKEGLQFGAGEVLQPSLYALAVEAIFPALRVKESRLSFCTAVGGYTERVVNIEDPLRERAREVLAAIDDAVTAGFLPPAPREGACAWCDFKAVCGPYEQERWRSKDRAPQAIQDLVWLRGLA